jgi:hypothetical protein
MRKMTWVVAGTTAAVVLAGSAGAAASQRATAGAPAARGAVAARAPFTWSSFTSPVGGTQLAGVWAGRASDVWAVGLQAGGACQYRTLTEHWDGSAWTVVASPSVRTVNSTLAAVSGTSASDVWAVGETGCPSVQNGRTLALHWNGSAWSIVKTPNPGFFPVLSSVAALTPADAWAVGDTTFSGADDPLIEQWNGSTWQVSKVPSSLHGALHGVAAVSTTSAWAVGDGPMALHWNGTRWSRVPVPIPAGTTGYLSAVAALPHGRAVAVGQWRPTPSAARVLIEQWNGTAWHMLSAPAVPGFSGLYSVAAAPGQGPWASGFSVTTSSGGPVVLAFTSGSWHVANPPPLAQAFSITGASDGEVWAVDGPFIAHGTPG